MNKRSKLFLITLLCLAAVAALIYTPARYQWAELLFSQSRYGQARVSYQAVSWYRDAEEKAKECGYRQGQARFFSGGYETARELFESVGDYKSARLKTIACEYMALRDPDGGAVREKVEEIFYLLDVEQSARELLQECNFLLGARDMARGDLAEAIESFQVLGDYAGSKQLIEECRSIAWTLAMEDMSLRRFQEALENFALAGREEDSEYYEKYCRQRLESEDVLDPYLILKQEHLVESLYYGKVYYYDPVFLYVPDSADADTGFFAYFSGGDGVEPTLYEDSMYDYLWNYAPNAVMLFYVTSGTANMDLACRNMLRIAHQAAAERGIGIHDLVIAGSSSGSYTALHLAAAFCREAYVVPRAVLTLDTAYDWGEEELDMSYDELLETARAGAPFYLFEQPGTGLNTDAIYALASTGNNVTAVYCTEGNHNLITRLAFSKGVFSWALGQLGELDPDEYDLTPLT